MCGREELTKDMSLLNADIDDGVLKMKDGLTFGPYLPTPNVQETVRNNPLEVPKRYLRKDEEMEKVNCMPHLSSQIPIIDFTLLSDGSSKELLKMEIACKEWGFFQIVNHGVQKEVMKRMMDAVDEFFKLPIEEKEKYAMPPDDIHGYGHSSIISEDQILDWSDQLYLYLYPTQGRKLQYWPKTPGFKEVIEEYSSEITRVGEELINSLSVILGLEKHVLLEQHKEIFQVLLLNYYPPCNSPEQVLGVSPHSDQSTITLLMQDDDVTGLQIRYKGSWVPVTPIPGALVVNIGDAIEIWSNGKYKSVEHRAVINKNKERTSIASFIFPQNEVEVGPFDHMIDAENPKRYQKMMHGEYLNRTLNVEQEGKKTQIMEAKIKE